MSSLLPSVTIVSDNFSMSTVPPSCNKLFEFDSMNLEQLTKMAKEKRETMRNYFRTGATKSYEWRLSQLRALRRFVEENEKRIGDVLYADLGRNNFDAWLGELSFMYNEIDHSIQHLKSWMGDESVSTNLLNLPAKSYIKKDPMGVALIIAPWNFPIQLLIVPAISAIAAGNCVMLKPSELAPASHDLLCELIPKYMDTDAVDIMGGGVPTATALLDLQWDIIFFTGGTAVGSKVQQAAAKHLTPTILELGGKSPAIINEEADVDLAARRITWGRYINSGQVCVSPDYVLVHQKLHDQFVSKVKSNIQQFYGENPAESKDYGRIITVNHAKRLQSYLEEKDKFNVEAGGVVDLNTKYVAPTVLTNVDPSAKVLQEEIFGPILPIVKVSDVNEAIEYVNSRPKPLALYVFGNDKTASQILNNTSSGGACVNDVILHLSNCDLPFGGVGPSGMGACHGRDGFMRFTHCKSVLHRPGGLLGRVTDVPHRYPPYADTNKKDFMRLCSDIQTFTSNNGTSMKVVSSILLLGAVAVIVAKFGFHAF